MTKHLGDVAITLIIFIFIVSAFSLAFVEFDKSAGQTYMTSKLNSINNKADDVNILITGMSTKMDDTSTLSVDLEQEIDERGGDIAGLAGKTSRNMIYSFFESFKALNLPGSAKIITLVISLIIVTVIILGLRMIGGDNRW